MMEVIDVDGFALSMFGDYHETLLWVEGRDTKSPAAGPRLDADEILLHESPADNWWR